MATRAPRKRGKKDIKAAADRAEKRSKGEEVIGVKSPVLEPEETAPHLGRPTDYDPSFCQIAADACARGATMEELSEILGVNQRTVYRWRAQHADFCQALKIGREMADERVGFSLYERAVGYTYDSVKIMSYEGTPVIVPYKEHVAPDVGAQKFWLTNRKAEEWREKTSSEITGKDGAPIQVETVDRMAMARWIAMTLAQATPVKAIDVTAG